MQGKGPGQDGAWRYGKVGKVTFGNDMDISKMTPQQRAELKAQLEAEERAEKQKREDDVNFIRNLRRSSAIRRWIRWWR